MIVQSVGKIHPLIPRIKIADLVVGSFIYKAIVLLLSTSLVCPENFPWLIISRELNMASKLYKVGWHPASLTPIFSQEELLPAQKDDTAIKQVIVFGP